MQTGEIYTGAVSNVWMNAVRRESSLVSPEWNKAISETQGIWAADYGNDGFWAVALDRGCIIRLSARI